MAQLASGCFESSSSSTDDAKPADARLDQAVTDTVARDGPKAEGLKQDGPAADLTLDAARPDGPIMDAAPLDQSTLDLGLDLFTKDSAPDTSTTCPASKMVWGQFTWGGDCVWQ